MYLSVGMWTIIGQKFGIEIFALYTNLGDLI